MAPLDLFSFSFVVGYNGITTVVILDDNAAGISRSSNLGPHYKSFAVHAKDASQSWRCRWESSPTSAPRESRKHHQSRVPDALDDMDSSQPPRRPPRRESSENAPIAVLRTGRPDHPKDNVRQAMPPRLPPRRISIEDTSPDSKYLPCRDLSDPLSVCDAHSAFIAFTCNSMPSIPADLDTDARIEI